MRLYKRMKKRLAKKRIGNYFWNRYINQHIPEEGKIYQDCDGFNHVLANAEHHRHQYQKGWVLDCYPTYTREDGHYFCGCMNLLLESAWTKEQIQQYHSARLSPEEEKEQRRLGWWTDKTDRLMNFIQQGGIVCDEQGLPSEEWKRINGNE